MEKQTKNSVLSKQITIGKGMMYPSKTTMNFVHDDLKKQNQRAFVGFAIFLVILAVFTELFVILPLAKVNQAESEYTNLSITLSKLKETDKSFASVKKEYDGKVGSYLTSEEQASLNRPEILSMIEEDVMPYVPVKSISVSQDSIHILTDTTNLSTVSSIVRVLQGDRRNQYATVTTASASQTDSSLVTADFEITFLSTNSKSTSSKGGND